MLNLISFPSIQNISIYYNYHLQESFITVNMDTVDTYTQRRLLFKCDNSIAKIYTNLFKLLSQAGQPSSDQSLRAQTIKQIDSVIFQTFKYKTALLTLQKDIQANQQAQVIADQQIEKSKKQIISLTEHVKSAELVRKRKLQYNEIAKSVQDFDTSAELTNKIQQILNQVQKLQAQSNLQMQTYAEKERCLRIALSSLRVLMRDQNGFSQSPVNY